MAPDSLETSFAGARGPLFRLAFVTTLLTVLTLGIYRFWMKTRLRRYYWSSVRPGGTPLEYVGQPIEKLLGFLFAVVVLAFYIGVVNLILMFASLSIFETAGWAYGLSFLGVIPLWFYAIYRARRYVLARTRWRGIRFALEPGAWGYAWRAMAHWAITILSLGLLWPRMTFWLEKYKTDRTWFGDVRLHQGGTWTMLYPAFWPLILSVVFVGVLVGVSAAGGPGALVVPMFLIWPFLLMYSAIHYQVRSFELLTSTKSAGDITLKAEPRIGTVFGIQIGGTLLAVVILSLMMFGIGAVIAAVVGGFVAAGFELESLEATLDQMMTGGGMSPALVVAPFIALYVFAFLMWQVLRHVFVLMPTWRHYAETLSINGALALVTVQQRDRDEHHEAEGFAEALDLGAAI